MAEALVVVGPEVVLVLVVSDDKRKATKTVPGRPCDHSVTSPVGSFCVWYTSYVLGDFSSVMWCSWTWIPHVILWFYLHAFYLLALV